MFASRIRSAALSSFRRGTATLKNDLKDDLHHMEDAAKKAYSKVEKEASQFTKNASENIKSTINEGKAQMKAKSTFSFEQKAMIGALGLVGAYMYLKKQNKI